MTTQKFPQLYRRWCVFLAMHVTQPALSEGDVQMSHDSPVNGQQLQAMFCLRDMCCWQGPTTPTLPTTMTACCLFWLLTASDADDMAYNTFKLLFRSHEPRLACNCAIVLLPALLLQVKKGLGTHCFHSALCMCCARKALRASS